MAPGGVDVTLFPVNSPIGTPARGGRGQARAFGRDAIVVTAGAMVANVAAYLVHLPASRWLGPELYGEFAALLSVQLIAAVPTLALQVVVARDRVLGASVSRLRAVGRRTALWLALLVAVAAWPVSAVLSVSLPAVAAAVVAAPVLALLSVELGLLQAAGRFSRFAALSAAAGLAKAVPAIAALAVTGAVAPTLAAEAAGTAAIALLARAVVSRTRESRPTPGLVDTPPRTDVAAVARAAQVQLALIALTTTDLLVARTVLEPVDAGNYALGSIATKVAFWLPAAVATVLFPQMSRPDSHAAARRLALAVVAGIGAVLSVCAALAAPLVPVVVGADYAPVSGWLWLFTAIGALQSLLQVLLLAGIAARRSREAAVAWAGVVLVAAAPLALATFGRSPGAPTAAAAESLLSVPGLATWACACLLVTTVAATFTTRARAAGRS